MSERLFLIDGHALIFKMYYAFLRRPMVNSKGMDTSILFGFTKYLLELIEREKPTHLAVAFDPPGGTFRNRMYPAYKANRPETPQLVIDALEPLTQLCVSMNIPVLMVPDYEADDVIGTMAVSAAAEGLTVYMVTPDKDYGQLISERIFQYKPGRGGGDDEIIGVKEICERYGIQSPSQVIDMLTICGDTADNVPGVKGIGEIWAGKLISRFGTIENIYTNIDHLTQKQRDMFVQSRPYIDLSKRLVTIKTDVPVETTPAGLAFTGVYTGETATLFDKYEFNSLKKYISHVSAPGATDSAPASQGLEVQKATVFQVATAACVTGRCAFVVEAASQGIFSPIRSVTVASTTKDGECLYATASPSAFKSIFEDTVVVKYGYDIKLGMDLLSSQGIRLSGKLRDVSLMHYLLDPEKTHRLDVLSQSYLGTGITPAKPVQKEMSLFDMTDEDEEADEASTGEDNSIKAAAILLTGVKIWSELQEAGLSKLYESIEEPLIKVLSGMEIAGVKVDVAALNEYAAALKEEMDENESVVRQIAHNPTLNVSSPKQIGELVFEQLKLDPKAKKNSKGSWSTDEDTLSELSGENPVIDAILDYRAARKLLSTYIEPFPGYISPVTGRIHTTFNQALTATGRLSSSNPNLQNIPVRTERGRSIRKAFIPGEPKWKILSADYSQIELRIMAHLCKDPHLMEAFMQGTDVHALTASKIFKVDVSTVTADQRRVAKTANFGIMYGISAFGLAQRLRMPRSEARKLIDDYFASFPSIRSFIDSQVEFARENGYVETIFGRRRHLPDITSKNVSLRSLAERNAINAPIQGSAADIIKMAMIRIDKIMRERRLQSRMVLQIHDELLFEVPPQELEIMKEIVRKEMESVVSLSVPLTVECNYGDNWLEAH